MYKLTDELMKVKPILSDEQNETASLNIASDDTYQTESGKAR